MVASVSPASFTMKTAAGQRVTVHETPATTYQKGTRPTSATAIRTGERVLVLGTTSGTTIRTTRVIVTPPGAGAGATAPAAKVIPFKRGQPTTSKRVGTIPTNWSEGSGTIVSGATANKATQAALAAYPGGIVDRVVKLGNGGYSAHYIGVGWPHHVFLSAGFQVVGAL